jgi:hypothetical protein
MLRCGLSIDVYDCCENGYGRQKTALCFFHGGNTGSIPVGRANDFKDLYG